MMPFLRFRTSEKRMRRRPYVVVRREEAIRWRRADADALRGFLLSESGQKLMKICDDSIIAGVLPGRGEVVDPELVGAIAAGKVEILEFMFAHAGLKRGTAGESTQSEPDVAEEEPVAAIQFSDTE